MSDSAFGSADAVWLKEPTPPHLVDVGVPERVTAMLDAIRQEGLPAVQRYSGELDGFAGPSFAVPLAQREAAVESLDPDLAEQIAYALEQIRGFAASQLECIRPLEVETSEGVHLGHTLRPVPSVGAYIPGGRYPLIASAFMTIAVAKEAGVRRVVALAPPRGEDGLNPVQLAAMHLSGADEIYAVGGVQALAAASYGVAGFGEPVDMLVGAGNAFVTEAKRQLFGTVGIDSLAGPSELTVIADESADPEVLATDLLGQAEHGPTSQVILVTTSRQLAESVMDRIPGQLEALPTREIAAVAWADVGGVVLCDQPKDVVAVVDQIAPEHLEVQTVDPDWYFERLDSYGTVFLGEAATVAYSDKAIGTNHVLPTGRAAHYTGGLWVGSFIRVLTFQRISADAAGPVADATIAIAGAEGLAGHVLSARIRRESIRDPTT